MALLKSCCCFTNVRSGSTACGVYSLVLSVISAGVVAYNLHMYQQMSAAFLDPADLDPYTLHYNSSELHDVYANTTDSYEIADLSKSLIMQSIFLCALVIACLLFCSAILQIIGVCLDKRQLLIPWMVAMAANVILDTGSMTYHTTINGSLKYIIIEMVIWLLLTVLNIYCLLCVFSQYQELKMGRGTRQYVQNIRQQRRSIMYHPGIQQVYFNQGPIIINGQLPQCITSSIQTTGPHPDDNTRVTATLLVSAPDYNIAAGQLPQYQESTPAPGISISSDTSDPLLGPPPTSRFGEGSDSPPPPYTS